MDWKYNAQGGLRKITKTSTCATQHTNPYKIRTWKVPAKKTNQPAGYQILETRLNVLARSLIPEPTGNTASLLPESRFRSHISTPSRSPPESQENPQSAGTWARVRGTRVPQRDMLNRR